MFDTKLNKLVLYLQIIITELEDLTRDKHSSLFCLYVRGEEKKGFNINTRVQWNKKFFITNILDKSARVFISKKKSVFFYICTQGWVQSKRSKSGHIREQQTRLEGPTNDKHSSLLVSKKGFVALSLSFHILRKGDKKLERLSLASFLLNPNRAEHLILQKSCGKLSRKL